MTLLKNYLPIIFILFCISCNGPKIVKGEDGRDMVSFDAKNSTMEKAMIVGNNTIDTFIKAFNAPKQNQTRFSIKVKISDDSKLEYVWLDEPIFQKNDQIKGVLLNNPHYLKELHIGDSLITKKEDIVDWSYIEDGFLVGGYTLRVMFEEYSDAEKNKIQQQLGYRIDPSKGI